MLHALSNKRSGVPVDKHGMPLVSTTGAPLTDAQPPFLLRYSSALFAREAPLVFSHDAETNRLSLQPGQPPPWVRPPRTDGRPQDKRLTWLYCTDCKYGLEHKKFLPFRDQAS